MDPKSPAEELPALYRAALDRVAQVAASGRRDLANSVRADAVRIYSRAWDDRARRELEALLRRHAETAAEQPVTGRASRRRTARAA